MKYFSNKNTKENIFFFSFLFFFILFAALYYYKYSFAINIFLFLFLFSSLIFGFVSKNPFKSFILGFLFWPLLIPLFAYLETLKLTSVFSVGQIDSGTVFLILLSVLWGFPGYFVSKAGLSENKSKKIIFYSCGFIACILGAFIFMILSRH